MWKWLTTLKHLRLEKDLHWVLSLRDRDKPDSEHEDKLHISTGLVARARAKKLEQALQNLWTHIRKEACSLRDEQVDSGLILVIKSSGPHQYKSRH
ncbi:hypothetical protein CDL15_Pgr012591 [Punica granatum]|uniref:Uncharacterized protein n=1 Tax=Punica granatum TaxID=22663 RepID=A0A218XYA0_PUNGR|nr:hypothetical protein CDL15_Pgr012591 [Punica granatum]